MDKTKIFEAAGKFASKGQLDKAAKEYQRILEEDPKDVRALQKLAEIFQKSGKTKESTDLMLRVAEGYSEQGFFLKAVAVYKQVLKVGPERIEVNQKLAQLYQQLGLIGDATQQYQTVANHHDKLGNVKESLAALRRMVDLDPDNVASQVKLGELYAREQMNAEAIVELRKASVFLKKNNRPDDYVRVLERIGQLAPDDPVVARELAQSFLAHGDTKRALGRLQVCFRADPKDVETLQLLARAFTDLGQDAKTVSVYRELAKVHADRGAADAERDILQRILQLAPSDEESVARLRAMAAAHAPPAVIAMAPPPGSIRASPSSAAAAPVAPAPVRARPPSKGLSASITKMLTETDVYLKYGLVPKAAEHIRKALLEDPRCLDAHEKLLSILDRQGKTDEALAQLVKMVELARDAHDADGDGAYTQDLAQRAPDHPLVRAAAAAAMLPELDDDEVIIEPEDGASIPPPGDDESIEINTETTVPPVPSNLPLAARGGTPGPGARPLPASAQVRERSRGPAAGSLGPRGASLRAAGTVSPGRAPWDPPSSVVDDEQVVVDPESLEPFEPRTIPGERRDERRAAAAVEKATSPHRKGSVSIAPMDPFALEDEALGPPNRLRPFREPVLARPDAPRPLPPAGLPTPPARREGTAAPPPAPSRGELSGRPGIPAAREPKGEPSLDASGPWSRGPSRDVRAGSLRRPARPPPVPPPLPEELPTVDALPLDEGEVPPPGDSETTSNLSPQSEAADDGGAEAYAEELAEAEFLVQQGLTDDARRVLEAILELAPGQVAATALLAGLQPEAGGLAPPEEPARGAHGWGDPGAPEPGALSDAGGGFDLGKELAGEFDLGKELAGEFDSLAPPTPPAAVPQHSVTDMLAEFKKKLSVTVSAEDSQTHYDLGIAYKEMGLYEEATHEFEVALQGRGRRRIVDCLIMLGVCRLEKGLPREALVHFEQALKTPGLTLEASKEAHFEIGVCLEQIGDDRGALDHYSRVCKADPSFRDVKLSVARLTQKLKESGASGLNGSSANGSAANGSAANGAAGPKNGVAGDGPEGTPAPRAGGPPPAASPDAARGGRGKIGYI